MPMYHVINIFSSHHKMAFFPPKMAIMKISSSFPPWGGRPWVLVRVYL